MKTNNIYFADVSIITAKERLDSYYLSFSGERIYDYKIYYKDLKKVLILCKKDKYEGRVVVDLNTNENLKFKMTTKIGNIFVNSDTLQPFNVITGNRKVNLSKRKIKKLGNPILNKLNKEE